MAQTEEERLRKELRHAAARLLAAAEFMPGEHQREKVSAWGQQALEQAKAK